MRWNALSKEPSSSSVPRLPVGIVWGELLPPSTCSCWLVAATVPRATLAVLSPPCNFTPFGIAANFSEEWSSWILLHSTVSSPTRLLLKITEAPVALSRCPINFSPSVRRRTSGSGLESAVVWAEIGKAAVIIKIKSEAGEFEYRIWFFYLIRYLCPASEDGKKKKICIARLLSETTG